MAAEPPDQDQADYPRYLRGDRAMVPRRDWLFDLSEVLGNETSALTDSFQDNLLAPPIYTRPREYKGWEVPELLFSGNHSEIEKWREEQAYKHTKDRIPDLLED